MAARRVPWVLLLSVAALVATGALVAGYLAAMRGLVQGYYRAEYHPQALAPADLAPPPPPRARLADVPWLSEADAADASVALRMLAAQQGRLEPRATLDFLLGATWGATPIPGRTGFLPGQDPEPGLLRAAPALGFTRRYLTSDRAEDFLLALRVQLARGRAVRVVVDRAHLLDRSGLDVRSLVLVGHDETSFEYYEPACDEPGRCEPGERPPGAPGLRVTAARLLLAVESLALGLQLPWTYQLLVLEPAGPGAPGLERALRVNAEALVGGAAGGPAVGAALVLETARALERHGDGVVSPELRRGLRLAAAARADDARALGVLFPGRAGLEPAFEGLGRAAASYRRALAALEAKDLPAAAEALHAGAAADREAGQVLLGAASGP
jgi:hypothetical protein